jgi:hypothetical protein
MDNRSVLRTAGIAGLFAAAAAALAGGAAAPVAVPGRTLAVTGHGVDLANGAIVYSKTPTAEGFVQQSTEIVELEGDLHGRVLYQVTSRFDELHKRLVNTGHQVYSGTISGSGPVMLYDDRFRFQADLASGAESGSVFLVHHLAGPQAACTLKVIGTGQDGQGNPTFTYHGECTLPAG